MTRPWTPDEVLPSGGTRVTVKRTCDGCGEKIGDVTTDEIQRAIDGLAPLSVAEEHGCQAEEFDAIRLLSARGYEVFRRHVGRHDGSAGYVTPSQLGLTYLPNNKGYKNSGVRFYRVTDDVARETGVS
jgi:hypothetical protein